MRPLPVAAASPSPSSLPGDAWCRLDGDLQVLQIEGPDSSDWLAGQTTNDVLHLPVGESQENAIADRQGRLQASFWLVRVSDDRFFALVPRPCAPTFRARLESHLFRERVTIGDWLPLAVLHLEGWGCRLRLRELAAAGGVIEGLAAEPLRVVRADEGSGEGFRILVPSTEAAATLERLHQRGFEPMDSERLQRLQIQAGRGSWESELDVGTLLSSTGLERRAVSDSKGCYVGQEVITRLKTYGGTKEMLCGLELHEAPQAPAGALRLNGKRCGRLTRWVQDAGRWWALAYLDKDRRTPGAKHRFAFEGGQLEATVHWLPIQAPTSAAQQARIRYEEALTRFTADPSDEDATVISLLEDALVFNPTDEDVHEVLGVVLQRHGRIDEAVARMETLAKLTPNAVMPHTNLSVLYMTQGRIEEAEMEKAKATALGFRRDLEARKAKKLAEAERIQRVAEAERKVSMFREVLEIDAADALANFGLGQALGVLGRHDEACRYLEEAVQVQADYSAAWLALGKAREFCDEPEAAEKAYELGMTVAARRGDLQPLREMERRLARLQGSEGSSAPN